VPEPDKADAESVAASAGPNARPVKLTELQEFTALVEATLDARTDEDGGELKAPAEVLEEARSQSPALYDWATRKHGVGDVHLAVIDLVRRKFGATGASVQPEPDGEVNEQFHEPAGQAAEQVLLLRSEPQHPPAEVGEMIVDAGNREGASFPGRTAEAR
jgi:hypothetical protein